MVFCPNTDKAEDDVEGYRVHYAQKMSQQTLRKVRDLLVAGEVFEAPLGKSQCRGYFRLLRPQTGRIQDPA